MNTLTFRFSSDFSAAEQRVLSFIAIDYADRDAFDVQDEDDIQLLLDLFDDSLESNLIDVVTDRLLTLIVRARSIVSDVECFESFAIDFMRDVYESLIRFELSEMS